MKSKLIKLWYTVEIIGLIAIFLEFFFRKKRIYDDKDGDFNNHFYANS